MPATKRKRKAIKRRASKSRQRKDVKPGKRGLQVLSASMAVDDAFEDNLSTFSQKTKRGRPPKTRPRRLSGSIRIRDSFCTKPTGIDSKPEILQNCSWTDHDTSRVSSVLDSCGTSSHKPALDHKGVPSQPSITSRFKASTTSLPRSSNSAKTSGCGTPSKRPSTLLDRLSRKLFGSASESKDAAMGRTTSNSRSRRRKQSNPFKRSPTSNSTTLSDSRSGGKDGSFFKEANDFTEPALSDSTAAKRSWSKPSTSKATSSRCCSSHKEAKKPGRSEMTCTNGGHTTEGTCASAETAETTEDLTNVQSRSSARTPSSANSIEEGSICTTESRRTANQSNHKGNRATRPADVDDSGAKRSASMQEARPWHSTMKGYSDSVKSAPDSCVDQTKAKSRTRSRRANSDSVQRESQAALIQTMENASGSVVTENQAEKETKRTKGKKTPRSRKMKASVSGDLQGPDSGEKATQEDTMEQQAEADPTPKPMTRKRKTVNKNASKDAASDSARPAKRRRVTKDRKTKKEEQERVKELEKEFITLQQIRTQCLGLGLRQFFDLRFYIRRLWKLRNDVYKNMQLSPKTVNLVNGCLALVYQLFSTHGSVLMRAVRKNTLDEHFLQDAIKDLMPDSQTYAYMMDHEGRDCLRKFYRTSADDKLARIFGCCCRDMDCSEDACTCECCHSDDKEDHVEKAETDGHKVEET